MQPLRRKEGLDTPAPASEAPTAAQLLARLEQAIDARLGALREGVGPLLEEVREHFAVLEPGPGGVRPSPKEQQERQAKLAKAMDQMEDVLEALYLAARGGQRSAASREG
jgi:hypothetical protein